MLHLKQHAVNVKQIMSFFKKLLTPYKKVSHLTTSQNTHNLNIPLPYPAVSPHPPKEQNNHISNGTGAQ